MALYWRSPYKETKNGGSHLEGKPSPRSSHSAKSAVTRFSEPVSPQDWFDASIYATKSSASQLPRRRVDSFIKGILKEPQSSNLTEEMEVKLLDSVSFDDTSGTKKAKKKVTFGVQNQESVDRNHEFQSSRSTSAHQIRLQNREPLDEFARQNLRKLLGYSQVPKPSLPTLTGKALLPTSDTGTPPTTAGSYGRKSYLGSGDDEASSIKTPRISESFQSTPNYIEHSRNSAERSALDLSVEGVVATPDQLHTSVEDNKDKDALDANEPIKPLKRHWTKSFLMKPTERKKVYRKLAGRYPLSAGTLHRSIPFRKAPLDKTNTSNEMADDFHKLHITGEGTAQGTTHGEPDPARHAGAWTQHAGPRSAEAHKLRGVNVPSTLTHLQESYASLVNQRQGASANQLRVRYGQQRLEGRDGTFGEQHLDKTAQILSWLQDVKQKEGFQPRNSRLYAVEVQQQH